MFDQRRELPLLPFGNPIGFVPASKSGVHIESNNLLFFLIAEKEEQAQVTRFSRSIIRGLSSCMLFAFSTESLTEESAGGG